MISREKPASQVTERAAAAPGAVPLRGEIVILAGPGTRGRRSRLEADPMANALRRRPVGTALLGQLLETPDLAPRLQALPPPALRQLLLEIGLEDAGELIALASFEQLRDVFDEDLWRSRTVGADAEFDAERFALWLEMLVEAGDAVVADRLAAFSEDFLAFAFSSLFRVVDVARAADAISDPDEADLLDKVVDGAGSQELDGYLIVARRESGWDAVWSTLLALDARQPELFAHSCSGRGSQRRARPRTPEASTRCSPRAMRCARTRRRSATTGAPRAATSRRPTRARSSPSRAASRRRPRSTRSPTPTSESSRRRRPALPGAPARRLRGSIASRSGPCAPARPPRRWSRRRERTRAPCFAWRSPSWRSAIPARISAASRSWRISRTCWSREMARAAARGGRSRQLGKCSRCARRA